MRGAHHSCAARTNLRVAACDVWKVDCNHSTADGMPVYFCEVHSAADTATPRDSAAGGAGKEHRRGIRCFSAQLSPEVRMRGMPHFALSLELDSDAKPLHVRIVAPGRYITSPQPRAPLNPVSSRSLCFHVHRTRGGDRYVLSRSSETTSWLSLGEREEELAAVIFNEVRLSTVLSAQIG